MENWWKSACVYQIYPASFNDSTGSGTGDILGIIEKLDHLVYLGIDVIWLSPVYASPMADNGYDISDYYAINPLFGTMTDMDLLIDTASEKGIKIIMDLVVNHTSDQHAWFQSALKDPESPYRDYYIWRENQGELPNDLESCFGGPAWTLDQESDNYYFHLFTKEQPDLNWNNEDMRHEIYNMMNWWLKKGITGFRMDVIDLIGKIPDEKITENGPMLHPYLKEMNLASYQDKDILTVGECWGADIDNAQLFSNPDGSELSMVFQFHHIKLRWDQGNKWNTIPLDLEAFKDVIETWQQGLHNTGWNSLFLGNHDLPRSVSYWGDDTHYRKESAKMLATLLHGLQGTPFVYQGEEIGMTNVQFDSIDQYKDVETMNFYTMRIEEGLSEEHVLDSIHKIGRDNARTPMQWSDAVNGGFSDGHPWIQVNPNYTDINVKASIQDDGSILNHYKKLIALRKNNTILTEGSFEFILREHTQVFAYQRTYLDKKLLCINNFSPDETTINLSLNGYLVRIHNYGSLLYNDTHANTLTLRPYESIILTN